MAVPGAHPARDQAPGHGSSSARDGSREDAQRRWRLTASARDQAHTLEALRRHGAFTGDPEIDNILVALVRPPDLGGSLMRGKLINPFLAEIARLDTTATAADPDAAGPLTSGYDPDFKETVVLEDAGAHRDARCEMPRVLVPCRVEVDTCSKGVDESAQG